ncbi:MAG TPA: LON peptidase substrate-binding domain-containing protein, partial [Anaerolineales bacterium]|nr:LON peptidase substrate-binding domain-containing protein [Anaerolineales bacterium]
MPASRWQTSMDDLIDWMGEADDELNALLPSVFSGFGKKDDAAKSAETKTDATKYPDILPILPLRGVVVYPQTAVPLTVGQPRSIKLV